jgi:hypothetical protein
MSKHFMRHKRAVAVAGSLGLHLLLLLLILPSFSRPVGTTAGGSVGDEYGVGEGATFTLYELAHPVPGALAAKEPEVQDIEDVRELEAIRLPDESLLAVADTELSELASVASLPDKPLPAESSSEAESEANRGATGTGGLTQGEGDDLWAAIAPCWNRVVDNQTVPVVLEVSFSTDGTLSAPPTIMRGDAAANNPVLLSSEAKAIQALAGCGAYPMAGGREKVAIRFPAS